MAAVSFFIAFVLVVILVYVLRYSGRLRFEFSQTFPVSVEQLGQEIGRLETWTRWNPWQEHDPDTEPHIAIDSSGVGKEFSWQSSRSGKIVVTNLKSGSNGRIVQKLVGTSPFSYKGRLTWIINPLPDGSGLTLRFKGRVGFAQRAFSKTVQKMIELDFRYALNKLSLSLSGKSVSALANSYQVAYIGQASVAAHTLPVRSYEGPSKDIGTALQPLIETMRHDLGAAKNQMAEVHYLQTNLKTGVSKCRYGLGVSETGAAEELCKVEAFPAFVTRLNGSLSGLEVAWYLAMQQMRALGCQPDQRMAPIERYTFNEASHVEHVDLYFPMQIKNRTN